MTNLQTIDAESAALLRDVHNSAIRLSVSNCIASGNYVGALEAARKADGFVERLRLEQRVKSARRAAMAARVDAVVMAAEAVML
jgi:hypothetical protein